MARQTPRFLYSNPTNTKTPGPFIVHTLPPFLIFKVERAIGKTDCPSSYSNLYYKLVLVSGNPVSTAELQILNYEGENWLKYQISNGEIKI